MLQSSARHARRPYRRSALVRWTPVRGSSADFVPRQPNPISRADPTTSTVILQVAHVGPSAPVEHRHRRADPTAQHQDLVVRQLSGGPQRTEVRTPERLVTDEVADTGNQLLIQQGGLHWSRRARQRGTELSGRQSRRIGSQTPFVRVQFNSTEATRIDHDESTA